MASTTFKIQKGELGFALTDPAVAVETATIDDYTAFSCVITSAALIPTQNFDNEDVPGTFCDPPSTTVNPSATTFTLDATVLQDPQDDTLTGLAQFLYDNDSGESGNVAYFYLGLADGTPPKAIGQCYLAPMDFGGEARVVLTADVSFPVEGRPDIVFGGPVVVADAPAPATKSKSTTTKSTAA